MKKAVLSAYQLFCDTLKSSLPAREISSIVSTIGWNWWLGRILVFSRPAPLEHTFMTTCQISHTSPEIYTYLPTKHKLFVNTTGIIFTITSTAHYCKTKCSTASILKCMYFFAPIYKSNIGSRYLLLLLLPFEGHSLIK